MVALKLNYLIIWNDFVPVNMQDVLDYAHENGVSVYLGFAWGWDTTMPDIRQWSAIADDVIRKYHAEYAAIPCDGIYFQTFTEHSDEVRDGIVVAEAAVHLVNKVSAALLAQKPTLQIQFGLHATSVLNRLDAFRQLDPRVSIIWEDVGAFPYHYMPHRTENFQQTRELNRHLQTLRDGGFGAVLKGVICLDWTCFRHQTGPFVLGCADRATATIPPQKKAILKLIQSYWLRNAHYAQALIQDFQEDAMVSCLVEDGYFEDCINLPTAIYAQLLWDSSQDMDELIQQAALRPDVTLF